MRANRKAHGRALVCAECGRILTNDADGDDERAGIPPYPECDNYGELSQPDRDAYQKRKAEWEHFVAERRPEVDHIKALALGGSLSEISNLRVLCPPCHRRKTAQDAGEIAGARRGERVRATHGEGLDAFTSRRTTRPRRGSAR